MSLPPGYKLPALGGLPLGGEAISATDAFVELFREGGVPDDIIDMVLAGRPFHGVDMKDRRVQRIVRELQGRERR